ncbi:MAG: hypothetical protein NTW25_12780, partial [Candidatus Kapabacteria bacterium]|nr:hypothetical protein [Candidatus Kapabacteria bacterium]
MSDIFKTFDFQKTLLRTPPRKNQNQDGGRQIALAIWKNFPNKFSKVCFLSNLDDIYLTLLLDF